MPLAHALFFAPRLTRAGAGLPGLLALGAWLAVFVGVMALLQRPDAREARELERLSQELAPGDAEPRR